MYVPVSFSAFLPADYSATCVQTRAAMSTTQCLH